jgi:hypothetical protein
VPRVVERRLGEKYGTTPAASRVERRRRR